MNKSSRIFQFIFFMIWTGYCIFFILTALRVDAPLIFMIVPALFIIIGIIGIVSAITGKSFGNKKRFGGTSGFGNNKTGRPSNGRLLRIWDESTTKSTKYGEETYYTYYVEFEYVDNNGMKCVQKQEVQLTIYSELMHTHDDNVPIIVYINGASLDFEKLDPMNRFKPHD